MANILLTGGTGQIGAFVCEELAKRGNNVVIYDYRTNSNDINTIGDQVKCVIGDVLDFESLASTMKSNEITHVVHLAAMLVLDSKERPAKSIRVNCDGTNNVFEVSRLLDVERTLFTSSVVVYGHPKFYPNMKVTEDDFPHCPPEPYSISKFVNESMSQFYRGTYGMDILCLRLTGVWGPGRYWGYTGRFNEFIRNVALEKNALLPEDFAYKLARIRWLYVKEMASAIVFALFADKSKVRSGVYNTGCRNPFSSVDLINSLKELMPNAKVEYKETDTPTQTSSTIAGPSGLDVDCSKLYDELGFREKLKMNDALIDMINFERSKSQMSQLQQRV